jgi:small subunit ribosomal protein S5
VAKTREKDKDRESEAGRGDGFAETVVKIRRCAAVVKGGRRFSFNALVVVGDRQGRVGWGYGKANEVPPAVEKAVKDGQRKMKRVSLKGTTIPHRVTGKYGAARVILLPAAPGTGVIAGASVRAVVEAVGIQNILTKAYGSSNPINLVKATLNALEHLRTAEEVQRLRGVPL